MRIVCLLIVLSVLLAAPASAFIVRSLDTARTWDTRVETLPDVVRTKPAVCALSGQIPRYVPCCKGLVLRDGRCAVPQRVVRPRPLPALTANAVVEVLAHKPLVANCYNGARVCDANVLYMCKDHEWKVAERCDANQVCASPRGCVTPATELRKTTRQPVTPLENCPRWKPYASLPKGCVQDLSNQVRWSR